MEQSCSLCITAGNTLTPLHVGSTNCIEAYGSGVVGSCRAHKGEQSQALMSANRRSHLAKAYRKLYKRVEWKRLVAQQLSNHPLCQRCLVKGIESAATIPNHVKPHRGDTQLFFDPDNLESLCAPCHDQVVQSEERGGIPYSSVGYTGGADASGWPTDPRHPANLI